MKYSFSHFLKITLFLLVGLGATSHAVDLTGCTSGFGGTGFNVSQGSAQWGGTVSVSLCVVNMTGGTAGASTTRIYVSADSNITSSDHLIGNINIPVLNFLSSASGTFNLTLPAEGVVGSSGTFYIGAIHDALGQVGETNESNNSNRGNGIDRDSLSITPPNPDLQGWDGRPTFDAYFDIEETAAVWGDTVNVRFAVLNNSAGNAGAFNIKLYVSADATIGDANDFVFQTVNFNSGLNAFNFGGFTGGYTAVTLPAFNPLPGSPTSVYIGMVVDADAEVTESNETNNSNQGNPLDLDGPLTITDPQPDIQVTDSTGNSTDLLVDFGNVVDDGQGESRGVQTIQITNSGPAVLNVSSVAVSGDSQFSIVDFVSSIENTQPLSSTVPDVVAPNGDESWIITVQYDPENTSPASATLTIVSDDPDEASVNVTLQGTGDPIADISVIDPTAPDNDLSVNFGGVLNDGTGGTAGTQTITLTNEGSGVLTISQNGISLLTGTTYSLVAITSSIQGAINLTSGTATIAPEGAETWDIVVNFDPATLGQLDDGIEVQSDDPDEATITVNLTGQSLAPMDIEVKDSDAPDSDLNIVFADTHADGSNKETASASITIQNLGEAPLTVTQNGITLVDGTHYQIESITSNTNGAIDLSAATAALAANQQETWTVDLRFDPTAPGNQATTLNILSDDPDEATVAVALSGVGLNEPDLKITDSQGDADDQSMDYSFTLNDGIGNQTKQETITLSNIGVQPLIMDQDGILFVTGTDYAITSIVSSIDGSVNLASGNDADRTIDPVSAETWTITVTFDPASNATLNDTIQIQSNDPDSAQTNIVLAGIGEQPQISNLADQLTGTVNISANTIFEITWDDVYQAGDAQIELFIDTDTNPADGLVSLTSGISEDEAENVYEWQPDLALEGNEYYLYASITDGSVTNTVYSTQKVKVDAEGSFNLRSAVQTTNAAYGYEFEYKGRIYTGTTTLVAGENTVDVTIPVSEEETATFQFEVTLVSSLIENQSRQYDDLNRIQSFTNGNGIVTTLYYDQMGRLERREADNGGFARFRYDPAGRRVEMSDPTGFTFYDYDDLGRLDILTYSKDASKGNGDDLAIDYNYDLDDRITSVTYPGGEQVSYSYDNAGRVTTANNVTQSLLTTYIYDPTSGQLRTIQRANGVTTTLDYDALGRLDFLRHERSGNLISEWDYSLNAMGNCDLLTINLPGGITNKEEYKYDDFDRLTKVTYSDDAVIDSNDRIVDYVYDGAGNRLSLTVTEGGVLQEQKTYVYGDENRIEQIKDQSGSIMAEFRYDSAGNRIQKTTDQGTTHYGFDERNLLISVITESQHVTYEYNGDGQRVSKTVDGVKTNFVLDSNRNIYEVLQERDESNEIIRSFTYGRYRLSKYEGSTNTFFFPDRIGSIRHTADASGNVLQSFDYDVFGMPLAP